jgi:hypothetical protein
LNIDAQKVSETKRHCQSDRNRNCHQYGRAPFPESDERYDHHKRDRFVQRVHEEIDVLFHLPRLIRCGCNDQVRRQQFLRLGDFPLHVLRKLRNLFAPAHLHSKRHGSRTLPLSVFVPPRVKIQIARGTLISAADIHQISQING